MRWACLYRKIKLRGIAQGVSAFVANVLNCVPRTSSQDTARRRIPGCPRGPIPFQTCACAANPAAKRRWRA